MGTNFSYRSIKKYKYKYDMIVSNLRLICLQLDTPYLPCCIPNFLYELKFL